MATTDRTCRSTKAELRAYTLQVESWGLEVAIYNGRDDDSLIGCVACSWHSTITDTQDIPLPERIRALVESIHSEGRSDELTELLSEAAVRLEEAASK